jgi:hypothetical protein
MLYNPATAVVNATTVGMRTVIDAHALPHLKLSKTERALLGADILDGITLLQNLTTTQVAAAVGVSPSYVQAARRLAPLERAAVEHGQRPLIQPRATRTADPVERLAEIIAEIGVDQTLDLLAVSEGERVGA